MTVYSVLHQAPATNSVHGACGVRGRHKPRQWRPSAATGTLWSAPRAGAIQRRPSTVARYVQL